MSNRRPVGKQTPGVGTACPRTGTRILSAVLAVVLGLLCPTQYLDGEESPDEGTSRPKIGLVLAGGGALGFAHIGVIRAFEQAGVPIDIVGGTSMGAIIAALYAVGYTADQMQDLQAGINWNDVFRDSPARRFVSYNEKQAPFSSAVEVDFDRRGFRVPGGLSGGQKLRNLFSLLTLPYSQDMDFDSLPVSYRAMATDLLSGTEHVLSSGVLADAMRASMSIPGAFAPAEIDGRTLVDGGVVDNLPVTMVQNAGAAVVIAVDITQIKTTGEDLERPLAILNQTMRIMINRQSISQRTLADIVIDPDLSEFSPVNFDRGAEIAAAGQRAAREQIERILGLVGGPSPASTRRPDPLGIVVTGVTVRGGRAEDRRLVERLVRFQEGRPIQVLTLHNRINRLLGSGRYDRINYSYAERTGTERMLIIDLQTAETRAHVLRVGFRLSLNPPYEPENALLASVAMRDLTGTDSLWITDALLSQGAGIETEYIQPIGNLFVAPRTGLYYEERNLYRDNVPSGDLTGWRIYGEARFGAFFRRLGEVSVGYGNEWIDATVSDRGVDNHVDGNAARLVLSSEIDTLDRFPFPTQGVAAEASYRAVRPWLGGSFDADRFSARISAYQPIWSRQTVGTVLSAGTWFGGEPVGGDRFATGGYATIPGLREGGLSGDNLIQAAFLWRMKMAPDLFLTVRFGVGQTWDGDPKDFSGVFPPRYGGGLGLGYETPIGPLTVNLGLSSELDVAAYLQVGGAGALAALDDG